MIKKFLFALTLLLMAGTASAERISLTLKDTDIRDVMTMLSKQQRLNIFVADGVSGKITMNIYDMDSLDAIRSIAEAAGFTMEQRGQSIFIIEREQAGKFYPDGTTQVRSFKVQYASVNEVEAILKEHLSSYGSIKSLAENRMLVIQDLPIFLDKLEALLEDIDRQPKQVLIEAKILEITLNDGQSFGIDWAKLFDSSDGNGKLGTQGLANPTSPGLFAVYNNQNVELVLNALKARGRLRTLSTPKLLAMEGSEAETVVGTRIGFKVTTTVNQVTSESIEFLETGIILKVTPSVDREGRILLDIHPEVSAGQVSDDGIPSKTTTQVSTRMLVPDGKTVFMGGLIRRSSNRSRESVPGLGDVPVIGALFSNDSRNFSTTEIVVLLTPRIIDFSSDEVEPRALIKVEALDALFGREEERIRKEQQRHFVESDDLFGGNDQR